MNKPAPHPSQIHLWAQTPQQCQSLTHLVSSDFPAGAQGPLSPPALEQQLPQRALYLAELLVHHSRLPPVSLVGLRRPPTSSLPPQHWGCPSAWGAHSHRTVWVLAQQQTQWRNKVHPGVLLGLDLLPDLQRWQQDGLPHPPRPVSQRQ